MKGQLLPAIIENIATRKDRSIKIIIGTQEMSPADAGQIFTYNGQLVTVYICPAEIDNRELEQVDKLNPELNSKSKSRRLRDVMFVAWKQNPEGYKTFDEYYSAKYEQIIDHWKTKLNP
jgi:hypothetical protein